MSQPSLDRNTLKSAGWALGACFTCDSAPLLTNQITSGNLDADLFVAVTHDCSVISPSLINEPQLEYISVTRIGSSNGQFTNARNIRRLHIEIEVEGESEWFEARMARRGFIDRSCLDECYPDDKARLSNDSLVILKRWLANRYISQTFPDKFNELTEPLVSGSKAPLIKAFNSEIGKACHSIFISLAPYDRDLSAGESYETTVVLLFRDEIAENLGHGAMEDFERQVKEILQKVDRISPLEVYAMAEADASYSSIVKMSRWQLDYVSIKDDSEVLAIEHS